MILVAGVAGKGVEYELPWTTEKPASARNMTRKDIAGKRAHWNTVVRFPSVFNRLATDRWVLKMRVKGTVRSTRVVSTRDLICAQYTSRHREGRDSSSFTPNCVRCCYG